MFAQLFGYYLLKKNILSAQQLNEALSNMKVYKARLGSLFTDAGYMTREQVEYVHKEQKHFDKRMGDIAVFLGFLTQEQMEELLYKQNNDDVVLAEALIDKGYITSAEYEHLIKAYRQEYGLDGKINEKNLARDIISIFSLEENEHSEIYGDYLSLFVRNMIRFIGDDFAFSCNTEREESETEGFISQEIDGHKKIRITVGGEKSALCAFAARYSGNSAESCQYTEAGDFLNLQNELYAANTLASTGEVLDISQQIYSDKDPFWNSDDKIVIPLLFTFGNIYINISA